MNNRSMGFASLLAVIGVSIVFGMLLGGRLNTPDVALAAPGGAPIQLAPAITTLSATGDFADIVEQVMPAVVSVTATDLGDGDEEEEGGSSREEEFFRFFFGPDGPEQENHPQRPRIGEGSGFIISDDGYVLTNNHVVEAAERIRIGLQNGREYDARVVGTDPSIDLALLKIDPDGDRLPTLSLGDSDSLRVGSWVIAIGNPLDYEHTVTVGVVSAKQRRVPIGLTDGGVVSFIQTDAAINFGNSGGPLLDGRGNVVGINTAIRRANYAEGIGFALPINHARNVLEQLRERGYVKRGYIGITMNQNGVDAAAKEYYGLDDEFGVIVDDLKATGPAARAGMERGDIIRKVDGQLVRDNLDLISKIASKQPGDQVAIEVLRGGETVKLRAELADREESLEELRAGNRPSPERPREEPEEEVARGLGITVRPLSERIRERLGLEDDHQGLIITDVEFESEAAAKNISTNMLITAVNGRTIAGLGDWEDALESVSPGKPLKVDLLAGSQQGWRPLSVFLRAPESR
jgi:serine protease Do